MAEMLSVAMSGLMAAQQGLLTTGHNISNAGTPGFSRQSVIVASTPATAGANIVGSGVSVTGIARSYDEFASAQVFSAQARGSYFSAYASQLGQLNNMLGDPEAGLSPALQTFFEAVQQVAANPASIPGRQALISSGQSLVSRFRDMSQSMDNLQKGVNAALSNTVSTINSQTRELAQLNLRISEARGTGAPVPGDLLDQFDQLVADLNNQIGVERLQQPDGTTSIYIGNGQALVVGSRSMDLQAVPDRADYARQTLALTLPGGGLQRIQESSVTGGGIGGLLAFRTQALDTAQSELGRIAIGVAQTVNEQHALGQRMDGNLGGDFFTLPSAQVFANRYPANTGTLSVKAETSPGESGLLTTSDYRLSFSSGQYSLTRLSDQVVVGSGSSLPLSADGFALTAVSGTPSNGDSFLIRPVRSGAGTIGMAISLAQDVALAAPLRTQRPTTNTGTGVLQAGVVSSVDNLASFPVTLTYSTAQSGMTGLPTGTVVTVTPKGGSPVSYTIDAATAPSFPWVSGATVSFNGYSTEMSGSPANSDTFIIERNNGGVGDNRNAAALARLAISRTLANGTASFQEAYGGLVTDIGNRSRAAEVSRTAAESTLEQAQAARDAVSGVNLDEEATNLLRYQQNYQAAGKLIEVAGKLFDTLLATAR